MGNHKLLEKASKRVASLIEYKVHESGKATLPTDTEIVDFFEDHLIDLKTEEDTTTLTFDTEDYPMKLLITAVQGGDVPIYGLQHVIGNTLIFKSDINQVNNQDVISVIENIKAILRQGEVKDPVVTYYINLMSAVLEVGIIYSSFVEILFANMFLVDKEKKIFWRYNQSMLPTFKLGDKMMAAYISSRIGLLYQPNKNTIDAIDLDEMDDIDEDLLTIYEKIYLGRV